MSYHWSTDDKTRPIVKSKLPNSPATGYVRPEILKIAVEIKADSDDFIPQYDHGCNEANLIANIPFGNGEIVLKEDNSEIIDCGFQIKLPVGYRCKISSSIPGIFLELVNSNRLKVNAFNFSEKVVLHHLQKIGTIWIEPIYLFDWIRI